MLPFFFIFILVKLENCQIYVNQNVLIYNAKGTKDSPFQNLSLAFKNYDAISNLIFILEFDVLPYEFFEALPINDSISIISPLYYIFLY